MAPLPAIRNVDLFPIEHEGETVFCISDPTGIVEQQIVLSFPAAFIAAQLDGHATLDDVRNAFRAQFRGADVSSGDVSGLVSRLDTAGFLQTESYAVLEADAFAEFRNRPTRAAHLAGRAYPAEPDMLREFLALQFVREGAAGRRLPSQPGPSVLPGIIVPHIDFQRGGHSYSHGYLRLYESGRPHTAVIFGVAHAAQPVPFILSRKAFETPLGTLEIDHDFLDAIEPACDFDPYRYEFTHKTEHSIEFQAVMLAYLYGSGVKIVPILTSHFIDPPHETNGALNPVSRFLDACRDAAANAPYPVTVIAGADLAHVGRRFGDDFDIDDAAVDRVRLRDEEDLAHVCALAPDSYYASVMSDDNARHVCGYNCIYSALRTVSGRARSGGLVHYGYAPDPAGGIVSFASAVLGDAETSRVRFGAMREKSLEF